MNRIYHLHAWYCDGKLAFRFAIRRDHAELQLQRDGVVAEHLHYLGQFGTLDDAELAHKQYSEAIQRYSDTMQRLND